MGQIHRTTIASQAQNLRRNATHRVEDRLETCDDCLVPLSEDEQRILRQIEQELESDPTFSQRGYRVSRRRSILLTLGLLLGFVITIGGLAVSFAVAFAGFVLVLVMAIMLESELRLLGRERLGQLPISAWLSGRRPDVDDDATR
jgi:Flp pilus assembly protein TadB